MFIGSWAFLFFGAALCAAAELKDVRIGEYDDFTRVVFEFSALVAPGDFDDKDPGRLTVTFPETRPRLIRRIPADRSDRIGGVQLWQKGTTLSAVLSFPFDRFRFAYFTLSEPDRIAIDIFPDAKNRLSASPALKDTPTQQAASTTDAGTTADAPPSVQQQEPLPLDQPRQMAEVSPIRETPIGETQSEGLPGTRAGTPPSSRESQPPVQTVIRQVKPSPEESEPATPSFTSRLQYYLVIGLVIITMTILVLLILMLLSRFREGKNNAPLNTNDYLQRQDEAIASLNARIQEQLKRYDDV